MGPAPHGRLFWEDANFRSAKGQGCRLFYLPVLIKIILIITIVKIMNYHTWISPSVLQIIIPSFIPACPERNMLSLIGMISDRVWGSSCSSKAVTRFSASNNTSHLLSPSGNRTWASHGLFSGKPLWFDAALVNKLVPCAWLLSGALEVWSLRLRLRLRLLNFTTVYQQPGQI